LDQEAAELQAQDDDHEVEEGLEQQMDGERGSSQHVRKAAQIASGLESGKWQADHHPGQCPLYRAAQLPVAVQKTKEDAAEGRQQSNEQE
jgi:hypothetical protein